MGARRHPADRDRLATIDPAPGTYVLVLELPQALTLTVGKLGEHTLSGGWYAYVGSAFGPGGLRARLSHHLRPLGRCHWHIDYLRQRARLIEVWWAVTANRRETDWVDGLSAWPGASLPLPGFGASDSDRVSHLIHFATRPAVAWLRCDGAGCEARRLRILRPTPCQR